MYYFIQKLHSGWAYIAIFLLVIAFINSYIGLNSKKKFTNRDKKIALFGLIAIHTQFLIGIILYFISQKGFISFGETSDPLLQLTSLEHPIINIIAITLITIGWSKHKSALRSISKFRYLTIFYGIGLVLVLSRIPWDLWFV